MHVKKSLLYFYAMTPKTHIPLLVLAILLPANLAHSQRNLVRDAEEPIDISTIQDEVISKLQKELIFLNDGKGHYLAVHTKTKDTSVLYYGDGNTFYQVRNPRQSEHNGLDKIQFWAPRTITGSGSLKHHNNDWLIQCDNRKAMMTQMKPAEVRMLLSKAVFKKPLWKRTPHALARDDNGRYYYVDRLHDDFGGKDFRVFVGKLGNLKKRRITRVANSTKRGNIFVTSSGRLRFVLDGQKALWMRNGRSKKLQVLPLDNNERLIYTDLGVYEATVGSPCDHM